MCATVPVQCANTVATLSDKAEQRQSQRKALCAVSQHMELTGPRDTGTGLWLRHKRHDYTSS